MKIIIGFSRPKNKAIPFFSWAIRAIDKTQYSHVYLRWFSPTAETWVTYEAAGHSVRFLSNKLFEKNLDVVREFEIEVSQECWPKLLRFCLDNASVPYGIKQILGIGIAKLFKLKQNPFKDESDTMVCSELVGRVLEHMGIVFDKPLDLLDPKDIYLKLEEHHASISR